MYEVIISKSFRRCMSDTPETYDHETKKFKTIPELHSFIKERYGKIKTRNKIYKDSYDNEPIHIGYIFGFWEYQYGTHRKVFEEHWVEYRQVDYSYPDELY